MTDLKIIRAEYREARGIVAATCNLPKSIYVTMHTHSGARREAKLTLHEARLLAHQLTEAIEAYYKDKKP